MRTARAKPYDKLAFHVEIFVIVVVSIEIQTIARELDFIESQRAFSTDVPRECNAFPVLEGPLLPINVDGDGRTIRALDPKNLNALKIRSAIASRLHAGLFQLLSDIRGRQTESFGERCAAFQFVVCEVGGPDS